MRKDFITREFANEAKNGTFNMSEQKSFFASKILEIEDEMYIGNSNINWTESSDKTQGIRLEDVNRIFDTYNVKKSNHSLKISLNQSDTEKRDFTKWEFSFNVREIVTQYIFSQLKTNRTFSGIENSKTRDLDIDKAIFQYIIDNVYPRIKFYNIVLYVQYYRIGEYQNILDANNNQIIALQYDTKFRNDLISPPIQGGETTTQYNNRVDLYKKEITIKNFQLSTDANQNIANVVYKQTQSSINWKWDYYFDVIWKKA